jgi:protein TonB
MTMVSGSAFPSTEEPPLWRWIMAAALVVLVHAGFVYWLLYRSNPPPAGEPPAAVMIELSPVAISPESATELLPGPQMTQVEPEAEEPPLTMAIPELPPVPKAAAVLVTAPKPKPKPLKKVEKKLEKEELKPPAPRTSAPLHTQAARGQSSAAPRQGASGAPSMSSASWHSLVGAHFARYPRYPASARTDTGTPSISFTLDRGGRLISARLARSSGSSALDQEAVAAAHRASPFPAPPAEMGGGSYSFTVPVRFHH